MSSHCDRLLLNRFYEMKKTGGKTKVHAHDLLIHLCSYEFVVQVVMIMIIIVQQRRPYLASECDNLRAAEKWRVQVSACGHVLIVNFMYYMCRIHTMHVLIAYLHIIMYNVYNIIVGY